MKIKIFCIITLLLSFGFINAQNESIIAGIYDSTMTYFDIDPDTVILTEQYPGGTTYYDLDINHDEVTDYQLEIDYVESSHFGGDIAIVIIPNHQNEVVYHRIDSTVINLHPPEVVKPFDYGESINNSYEYSTKPATLFFKIWRYDKQSQFHRDFFYSIDDWMEQGEKYMGIRMEIDTSLVYGWVKIELLKNIWRVVVMEYALAIKSDPSVIDSKNEKMIRIYPNPFEEILKINIPQNNSDLKVEIVDMFGHIRMTRLYSNQKELEINTTNLNKGFYILRVTTGNEIYNSRIIKK